MTDPIAWVADQLNRKDLPGKIVAHAGRATLAVRNAVTTQWRTRAQISAITGAAKNTMAMELRRMEANGEIEIERGRGGKPDRYRRI